MVTSKGIQDRKKEYSGIFQVVYLQDQLPILFGNVVYAAFQNLILTVQLIIMFY